MQVSQGGHILHALNAGLVHCLDQLMGQDRARVCGRLQEMWGQGV